MIATAEILLLTNPRQKLLKKLDSIQDLRQHLLYKQIKLKGINFSNSIWEKSRKLQKETCLN